MTWDLSCLDWADRLRTGRSLVPDLPLVKAEADRAAAIFGRLRLPDVPDQPLMADAAGEWQQDIVRALFGSWDAKAGERFIREVFVLVPKKNSKTTGGAGIMVTALLVNRRPRAEFLLVAPTQEVADLAFRQAVGMIEADEVLKAKFHIQEHLKKITYRPGAGRPGHNAFLKVKSFDPKVVTGSKPSGVLIDEMHVIAESPDADRVVGQLRGGLLPNPEGFLITITTQSERPPRGVFKAELQKARRVRDGGAQLPILPVLYEFPEGIDWRDSARWPMVLPNNGRSVSVERLLPDYQAAVEAGEEELRRWASQHLNVEIGLALRSDRWVGADHWLAAADRAVTLDHLLAVCEVVVVGIDGGGLDDLLGLALVGRERGTRRWLHWGKAWAHPSVLERRKSEASRLQDFAREDDLVIVEQAGDDIEDVADIVEQVKAAGLLPEKSGVGVDPAGIGAIVDALAEREIADGAVVGVPQGWRLNGAIKTIERKLVDGTLAHGGQPLMAWAVGNAKTELRGNAVSITKAAAGTAKIDPLMALFNAAALMAMNPAGQGPSVYEERGILVV